MKTLYVVQLYAKIASFLGILAFDVPKIYGKITKIYTVILMVIIMLMAGFLGTRKMYLQHKTNIFQTSILTMDVVSSIGIFLSILTNNIKNETDSRSLFKKLSIFEFGSTLLMILVQTTFLMLADVYLILENMKSIKRTVVFVLYLMMHFVSITIYYTTQSIYICDLVQEVAMSVFAQLRYLHLNDSLPIFIIIKITIEFREMQ